MEFNELFEITLIQNSLDNLTNERELIETTELFSLLSCFDSYKLKFVKQLLILKSLTIYVEKNNYFEFSKQNQNSIYNLDYFNFYMRIINISLNFSMDKKKEMTEQYKKNYEINDEELKSWEDLQSKYNKDLYEEATENLTYHEDIIKKYNVHNFISKELKIVNYIINLFEKYQNSLPEQYKVLFNLLLIN